MSKLLKKLKHGTRVVDIESGVEGYVSYNRDIVPNNITVEFEPSVVMSSKNLNIAAISYPISDIENRIKLAPKYGNYKVGDRVKIGNNGAKGIITEINLDKPLPILIKLDEGCFNMYRFRLDGINTEWSPKPILKRLKVKQ
jgi:hypothetical protein